MAKPKPGLSYVSTSELVSLAKMVLGICTPNALMSDNEIRKTIRWIGMEGACHRCPFKKPFTQDGDLILMLVITSVEFPRFFTKYGLYEEN
jgi:hypothetical protein